MRKQIYRHVVMAWSALGVVPAAAQAPQTPQPAQPTAPATDARISITPFMALGDDLALGGGLSVTFPLGGVCGLQFNSSVSGVALDCVSTLMRNRPSRAVVRHHRLHEVRP
jgi:hypothetical protein